MPKKIKIATRGIADEFRDLNVGDTVFFPISRYNYNTIRACPATSLVTERMYEGKNWTCSLDHKAKGVRVKRTS